MFNRNVVMLVVIILSLCSYNIAVAQTTMSADVQGTLKTFEKKWKEYIQALGNVEGIKRIQYKLNGEVDNEFAMKFICLYPLMIDERGQYNNYDSVACYGKKYDFVLSKSEDNKWIIKRISCEPSNKKLADLSFPIYRGNTSNLDPSGHQIFVTLAVGLFGIDASVNLPYMVSSENFVVKEFRKTERNGITGFLLDFDFSMALPEEIKKSPNFSSKLKGYSLHGNLFLVTDYFLVSEGELHLEYLNFSKRAKVNISYDTKTYKVPLPQKYYQSVESTYQDGKKYFNDSIYSFDMHETNPKDIKRFNLTAYGLPEYDCGNLRESSGSRIRYIVMGLGLLLIGISAWLMIRKRQR